MVVFILLCVMLAIRRRQSRQESRSAAANRYEADVEGFKEHLDRGAQNFKYKELKLATKGFSSNELIGSGGFGSVYRGQMRLNRSTVTRHVDVAVKRSSETASEGIRQFLAEVKSIGQVQHRNLMRLLGWCHEKGVLLLVYDYMPNGSVDQHLYGKKSEGDGSGAPVLTWERRLKIVNGVAMALAFLHEEWEQRVIHRDVKSSNVMLDSDFNARLGDFGLARLSDHGQGPCSTAILAGTLGYMAPELYYTLKATEKTDVYSFGAFVLEMATGRRPLLSSQDRSTLGELLLVDWVWSLYKNGKILEAADSRLLSTYDPDEMTTLLKIGLLFCHPNPDERPNMREFLHIWKGSIPFPPLAHTKPVPTYLRLSTSRELDFDGNQSAIHMEENSYNGSLPSFPMESDHGDGDTRDMTSIKEYRHSAVEIGQPQGKRPGAPNLGLTSVQAAVEIYSPSHVIERPAISAPV